MCTVPSAFAAHLSSPVLHVVVVDLLAEQDVVARGVRVAAELLCGRVCVYGRMVAAGGRHSAAPSDGVGRGAWRCLQRKRSGRANSDGDEMAVMRISSRRTVEWPRRSSLASRDGRGGCQQYSSSTGSSPAAHRRGACSPAHWPGAPTGCSRRTGRLGEENRRLPVEARSEMPSGRASIASLHPLGLMLGRRMGQRTHPGPGRRNESPRSGRRRKAPLRKQRPSLAEKTVPCARNGPFPAAAEGFARGVNLLLPGQPSIQCERPP